MWLLPGIGQLVPLYQSAANCVKWSVDFLSHRHAPLQLFPLHYHRFFRLSSLATEKLDNRRNLCYDKNVMAPYRLYFDGSCSPVNPGGTAKYGFALFKEGVAEPVEIGHGTIGTGPGMTNNLAEFTALWRGLQAFLCLKGRDKHSNVLNCLGDSQLVVNIMNTTWHPHPEKSYFSAYRLADEVCDRLWIDGNCLNFQWIPREKNQFCDDLSKL